jgi:hypothetical protein
MGSSLGHRSTRHGKRDGQQGSSRRVLGRRAPEVCREQSFNKHAVLIYREMTGIEQALAEMCGCWV